MNKFEKELRRHHNENLKYNYQFEKIKDELDLIKDSSVNYSKQRRTLFLKPIVATLVLLIVAFSGFWGGYYYKTSSIIDVPGYTDKLAEKLGYYTDGYIESAVYTEVFSDDTRLVFYFGVEKNGTNPVLVLNFYSSNLQDEFSITVEGVEHIIKVEDYSNLDENNWEVIKLISRDSMDIEIKFTDHKNQTFSSNFVIDINKYINYLGY